MADEIKNNTHIVPTLVCPFDYPDFTSRARIAKRWLDLLVLRATLMELKFLIQFHKNFQLFTINTTDCLKSFEYD